jgi:hypothetical protein
MNAKEKAKEIFNKMLFEIEYNCQPSIKEMVVKKCALIAVEEILKCESTEPSDTDWDDCGGTAQYYWPQKKEDAGKFWGDVKLELQSF